MRFKGIPRHARIILGAPRTTRGLALPTRAAIAGVPRKPQLDGLPVLRDRGGAALSAYAALIANSIRLRSAASSYFSRTHSAGNRTTWTYSVWIKRGLMGTNRGSLLGVRTAANDTDFIDIGFYDTDKLQINGGATTFRTTTMQFRDPTSWYHIVVAVDTNQATANNRIRLYVNGVEVTAFDTLNNPTLSANTAVNQNTSHVFGVRYTGAGALTEYFDGNMAWPVLVEGQQLTPSAFGQFSSLAPTYWTPKVYAGTFGTNGGWYKFEDASAATAAAIGKDSAGANNWTPSAGISVTAGVTFDQSLDTPTNNFATLDPNNRTDSSAVLANANMSYTGGNNRYAASTVRMTGGKWYFEGGMSAAPASGQFCFGVSFRAYAVGAANDPGFSADTHALYTPTTAGNRGYWTNSAQVFNVGATLDETRTYKLAIDIDAGKAWLGYDTVWFNSSGAATGDPASGANPTFTFTPGTPAWAVLQTASGNTGHINFGQRPFAQAAPSGFSALRTQSMAASTITIAGAFTGNAAADGPPVWIGGSPATLTINGNPVTWGTHADKTAGGFKLRTTSASYNTAGTNNWTATGVVRFVDANKIANLAQVNP